MSNEHPTRRPLTLKQKAAPANEAPRIEERLHKVLAQAGLGSRRALEQRIAEGQIKVNGEPAITGMSISGGDKIELDGKTFVASALTDPSRVLMYNKPEGEVTTREDPEGRPTIFEALPKLKGARWITIGRLDINTTGLLLLTTDGELANGMMHPSFEVEREYVCRVRAPEGEDTVSDKIVDRLARGVALDDGPAKFDEIERIGGTDSHDWFRVLLKEGRNREVRRLWESQGCQVSRLKRIRYGLAKLPQPLLRGHSQEMTQAEVDALRKAVGLEDGTPSALTLMPVLGQRKASKTVVAGNARSQGYVGGHNTADEGRELRRFDNVREDRGRRGAPRKPHGGLTVSGETAAKQANNRFKVKGPRPLGQHMKPGEQRGDNPAAMRTWFVPDGVDTGPSGHRNPDGARGPRKPYGSKPGAGRPGARGPGGSGPGGRPGGSRPYGERGPGGGAGERGPRREGGFGAGDARPQRTPKPYGHPGNAPHFPSDHAHGGGFNPYGASADNRSPRGPRPAGGNRPGNGPKPGGNRPGNGPRGPRPAGGNRGPRGPGGR
ncbi:pseudouridine synthase [Thermomonas paludicola]|uniref:pseudouridine synthase n=1 Tax=Thermomonas paludicola TaxID=2884874 RepID=UPI002113A0DD|nr:pseudouridine synthase [Thermomonas paludicola]